MICGKCHHNHETVAQVKECYKVVDAVPQSEDFKPMALNKGNVPAAKYAVEIDSHFELFEVQYGKDSTKWAGFPFLSRLLGAPGDWRKIPVKGFHKNTILAAIANDPVKAVADFGHHYNICGKCGSPLSDEESVRMGLGPICAKAFA